jgi:uncharacterized protein with GYD domain
MVRERRFIMATFISLVNFTEQGARDFNATVDRAAKFGALAEGVGVKLKDVYWTMGAHDALLILEAPDNQAVVAALLKLASLGNVRTQTLPAFNSSEMRQIISKVPKAKG